MPPSPLTETQPFVDKLFESINNKSYLPQLEQPSSVVKVEKDEQKKEEVMFLSCREYLRGHFERLVYVHHTCTLLYLLYYTVSKSFHVRGHLKKNNM